jgi:hypothetical protein
MLSALTISIIEWWMQSRASVTFSNVAKWKFPGDKVATFCIRMPTSKSVADEQETAVEVWFVSPVFRSIPKCFGEISCIFVA